MSFMLEYKWQVSTQSIAGTVFCYWIPFYSLYPLLRCNSKYWLKVFDEFNRQNSFTSRRNFSTNRAIFVIKHNIFFPYQGHTADRNVCTLVLHVVYLGIRWKTFEFSHSQYLDHLDKLLWNIKKLILTFQLFLRGIKNISSASLFNQTVQFNNVIFHQGNFRYFDRLYGTLCKTLISSFIISILVCVHCIEGREPIRCGHEIHTRFTNQTSEFTRGDFKVSYGHPMLLIKSRYI